MWVIRNDIHFNWVKFIPQRIEHYRTSLKRSFFYSSFIQLILELNGITSTDEELVKELKPLDSITISLMCYSQDKKEYYYLHTNGSLVFEDMFVKLKKKKQASSTKKLVHNQLGYCLMMRKCTLMISFGRS